jgi:molybdate transport system substrate-binding protein
MTCGLQAWIVRAESNLSLRLCRTEQPPSAKRRISRGRWRAQDVASTAFRCTVHWGMVISLLSCFLLRSAEGEDLVLYGAGSLREVMTQIASDYQAVRGTHVRTDFGPSGLMRERIQRGEKVDVFASADLGHPLQLQQEGRATIVVMFTRNTLCAVALPRLELTSGNFLDKLLDPGVKLGTSTPKADPAGDYTWAMFRLADRRRQGSFAILDKKAQQIVGGTLPHASGSNADPAITALRDGVVDVHISYCTSARLRMSQVPDLQLIEIPEPLRVGPEYGLALVRGANAAAAYLMLYILSLDGQATLRRFGFNPVGLPSPSEP